MEKQFVAASEGEKHFPVREHCFLKEAVIFIKVLKTC